MKMNETLMDADFINLFLMVENNFWLDSPHQYFKD